MTPGCRRLQAIGVALFLAAVLSAAPRPARAQIRGTVTDEYGRPLPGVLVELWDAHRRLAGDGTDAAGIFRLSPLAARPQLDALPLRQRPRSQAPARLAGEEVE